MGKTVARATLPPWLSPPPDFLSVDDVDDWVCGSASDAGGGGVVSAGQKTHQAGLLVL